MMHGSCWRWVLSTWLTPQLVKSVCSPTGRRWQAAVWCGPIHPARGLYSSGPWLTGPAHDHQLYDSSWMDLFVYVTISELWDLNPAVPVIIVGSDNTAIHIPAGPSITESSLRSHIKVCAHGMGFSRGIMLPWRPHMLGFWCSWKYVNVCNCEVAVIFFFYHIVHHEVF